MLARGAAGWVLTPLGEHAIAAAEGVERALGALTPERARLSGVVRLSATDGFSGFIASPAIAAVRRAHPDVSLEIVAATAARRPAARRRRPRGGRRPPARASCRGDPPRRLRARPLREPRVPGPHGTPALAGRARGRAARVLHRVDAAGRRARRGAALDARHGRRGVEHERVRARRRDAGGRGVRPAARVPRRPARRPRAPVRRRDRRAPALLAGVPARGAAAADRARVHRGTARTHRRGRGRAAGPPGGPPRAALGGVSTD